MDDFEYIDLEDHFARMVEVTNLLNRINGDAAKMRFQFGEPPEFLGLVAAIEDAQNTWISSNC